MNFDLGKFEAFCAKLRIDSKERGRVPLKWIGSQKYLFQEIADGLNNGIHTFVILKGRQMGISTGMLALDLYWLFKHPGIQGGVVTDTDENRELFRSLLTQYMESLPSSAKPEKDAHNRTQLILKNSARLMYLVAGIRKSGGLGRAKAFNFLHATECSSWGDEEGFQSLMNTLAQQNPDRLYIFESTARGYDMFYETWEVAKKSNTQKAIFIGWWRNEFYRKERTSPEFRSYWDGELTPDEKVWVQEVWEVYHVNIVPEQIAWWRWYVAEQMKGDEQMALQEMGPSESYCFQLSGSRFFSAERTNMHYQFAIQQDRKFFRYDFGLNFEDTKFIETNEDNAEVCIWAWPEEHNDPSRPQPQYVLGCDPAYGSSEWADEFAGYGARCYADKLEQVFQIGTTSWTEAQYAWVILHLAGYYGNTLLALEMQGPGGAVLNEIRNVQNRASSLKAADPMKGIFDVVGNVRNYLWRKQDSMASGYALQWQTNHKEKIRMFSQTRSYFERDMLIIKSPECLAQFRNIHRQGDQIGGEGRAKDDQVVAMCIATIAWNDNLLVELQATNQTYVLMNRPPEEIRLKSPLENSVKDFLTKQGIHFRAIS